ncbi:IS3 family transposase, partial [Oscillospiraceae bacterium HV4-5-C5C]|nr:IS3 family transposase [Oscillospiraceae bacterium HV4-5-C5C]
CEGFFGRLKNELFYPRSWLGYTLSEFIQEVNQYMIWYRDKRIKRSLGNLSPIEFRKSLGLIS